MTPVLDESIGLAPADDAPGLAPLDDAPSLAPIEDVPSLTPVDKTPSLTPLDDVPSLTPVDESPGLTPVDDIPALSPFETGPTLTPLEEVPSLEPQGASTGLVPLETQPSLTPLADDPLAGAAAYQGSAPATSPSAGGLAPNPFGDNLGPASAPGGMAVNPYQSPALAQTGYGPQQPKPFNEAIVVAPAIAMMVVAGLNCLVTIPYLIFNMVEALAMGKAMQGEDEAFIAGYVFGSVVVSVILCVVVLAVYVLTFIGAWKMKKMEGYGLAITASILMMLPCTFCWSGLPFGIWALVVLCLQDVRQAFR